MSISTQQPPSTQQSLVTPTLHDNPFASPMVAVSRPDTEPAKRASEETLAKLSRFVVVANLFYLINVICYFSMVILSGGELGQIMMIAYVATGFVLWYSTVATAFVRRNYLQGILIIFCLPIPLLGSLSFLSAIGLAKQFMVANGYRPKLLGFVPDLKEQMQMAADSNYVPHRKVRFDGSKRRLAYMLGECSFILLLLIPIVFLMLGILLT